MVDEVGSEIVGVVSVAEGGESAATVGTAGVGEVVWIEFIY